MKNKVTSIIQSLLCCIIYITIIYIAVILLAGKYISEANSYIELISTKAGDVNKTKLEMGDKGLKLRPEYGKEYGKVTIPSVGIELPLLFGNSLDVLKNGIGQNTRSFCPRRRKNNNFKWS